MQSATKETALPEIEANIPASTAGAKEDMADTAYQAIRTGILSLSYAPGSTLSEAGLAKALGLGRMPVRMAIKRLKAEGWIVASFRCQTRVKSITAKDITEIYQLRRLMEEKALEQIFRKGFTWDYSFRLEEKLLKIKAAQHNAYERELAESAWHLEMLKIFDNERLEHMYAAIQDEAVRIALSYMAAESTERVAGIIRGLERFCLALRENRLEEARLILQRDHWQGAMAQALEALEETEETEDTQNDIDN